MTIHSSLYRAASVPLTTDGTPDPQHYPVGTLLDGSVVIHAQPGVAPVSPLTVYHDGASAWTWGQIATAFPKLSASVAPHRWDEEYTDSDVTAADWPLLAPALNAITATLGLGLGLGVAR